MKMRNRMMSVLLATGTLFATQGASAQMGKMAMDVPPAEEKVQVATYPLGVCLVTGEKLGSKGAPVILNYGTREIRFCCKGCVKPFQADPDKFIKKMDTLIVKSQKESYPLKTCPITGERLGGAMGVPIDYVYGNRLIRFCCKGCISKFEKDPKKTLAQLDNAVIAAQTKTYPLKTCVISGDKLGGNMGKPIEYVFANQLVRLCCKGCVKEFNKEPLKYLAKIQGSKDQSTAPAAAPMAGM